VRGSIPRRHSRAQTVGVALLGFAVLVVAVYALLLTAWVNYDLTWLTFAAFGDEALVD
jgi:hypothetical protein